MLMLQIHFSISVLTLSPSISEAVPAARGDHELSPRAPARARGENLGPRGRHGPLGAEVFGREHNEAVCNGSCCHRCCTEVKTTGVFGGTCIFCQAHLDLGLT